MVERTIAAEVTTLKRYLQSKYIHTSDVWLESFLEWYRSNNAEYADQELKNAALEQWLLSDLKAAEIRALPPNISAWKKETLNGEFCLQVQYVMDISKPKHWQLQKIRNKSSLTRTYETDEYKNNNNNNNNSKRMLQLCLSDGVQDVTAIEYKTIPTISVNVTPGIKVLVRGPLIVRRGQLMLESCNVKVLGGEVEELLVCNAAENVLARELGLPVNERPISFEEYDNFPTHDEVRASTTSTNVPQRADARTNVAVAVPPSVERKPTIVLDNELPSCWDEDLRFSEEVRMILEAERDLQPQPLAEKAVISAPPRPPTCLSPEDMFGDDMDFDEVELSLIERKVNLQTAVNAPKPPIGVETVGKAATKIAPPIAKKQLKLDNFSLFNVASKIPTKASSSSSAVSVPSTSAQNDRIEIEDDDDFFNENFLSMHLDQIDKQLRDDKDSDIIMINNLIMKISSRSYGTDCFKVKAKFRKVVEKFTVTELVGFSIKISIYDDTGDVDVAMENDVIEKMIGISKDTVLSLKCKVFEKDCVAKNEIFHMLTGFKEKLLLLDNVLIIMIKDGAPCIKTIL